jgi:adenylate cyclase
MGLLPALGFASPLGYFVFIILSTLRLDFWLSAFTGAVAASQALAMALWASSGVVNAPSPGYHAGRSLMLLVGGILAGAVGAQLRRQFEKSYAAATQRDYVTNLFGQHVSPQVVERLLMSGAATASDVRKVAVMFVDIRGFTAAAKSRSPQEVVERLNVAFSLMVDAVDRHGGIVNKFLGDGFLALFGAPIEEPDPAHRAIAAAREILTAIDRDNEGQKWPLRMGIGLHLGDVVAGNVGSPRRKEYTVIGDTVNFASRVEALNKEYGSQLLISDTIREAARDVTADAVSVGEVTVRGYDQPTTLWKLA